MSKRGWQTHNPMAPAVYDLLAAGKFAGSAEKMVREKMERVQAHIPASEYMAAKYPKWRHTDESLKDSIVRVYNLRRPDLLEEALDLYVQHCENAARAVANEPDVEMAD